MKPDLKLNGDIKECCIACLNKSQNMYNLIENTEKRVLFSSIFNVELTDYKEYPHFLCCVCDIKLNVIYTFQENVRKCLTVLKEYNEKIKQVKAKEEFSQLESENKKDIEPVNNEKFIIKDETTVQSEVEIYRSGSNASEPTTASSEEVSRVIEEFKNKLSENKTCVLCGFITANRRAISSHMAIFHKDEKSSWCLECNDIFDNYEEHKQTHNSKYECPFCKKQVTHYYYVEHLQSHAGAFKCEFCKKTFKSAAWLKKHTRIHTNDKLYVCPNCRRCFIQINSLRYHLSTHGQFSCDSCKKHYKSEKDLQEHECEDINLYEEILIKSEDGVENGSEVEEVIIVKGTEVTGSELQNFCKECNKRVKSLNQHLKKHHTVSKVEQTSMVKQVTCEFCQKIYNNAYKLKVHMRTHTGEMPYKCQYCDKRMPNRARMKEHERMHTKEKPYICNICGKALSQASGLRTHMMQHTGRPEVCGICNKRFCRKSELKLHLSKHMGKRPFLCTECGKTFAQKSHLSEHLVGHGEARPFQCAYCEKAFKKKILLKEHIKIHKGYKPFQCPSCDYTCYKAYRLQQHMKRHITDLSDNNEEEPQ